jgi:hypothetical protein
MIEGLVQYEKFYFSSAVILSNIIFAFTSLSVAFTGKRSSRMGDYPHLNLRPNPSRKCSVFLHWWAGSNSRCSLSRADKTRGRHRHPNNMRGRHHHTTNTGRLCHVRGRHRPCPTAVTEHGRLQIKSKTPPQLPAGKS